MFSSMEQDSLFPDLPAHLTDEETTAVLHAAIARGIRWSRAADLYLSGICANYLVHELRLAGLAVVKIPAPRLRD